MVVLKLGRSEFGQRATLAHTGTLAGRHEAFAALFRQNGVAMVDSIDALVETAALFDLTPLPQDDRELDRLDIRDQAIWKLCRRLRRLRRRVFVRFSGTTTTNRHQRFGHP